MVELVREFLEFYNLGATLSVFTSECDAAKPTDRNALRRTLGLDLTGDSGEPLLAQLVAGEGRGIDGDSEAQVRCLRSPRAAIIDQLH